MSYASKRRCSHGNKSIGSICNRKYPAMKLPLTLAIGTIIAVTLANHADAQMMRCPIGTYNWTDGWGNATCRSFDTQQDVIVQPNAATGSPNGSMPSMDRWGNTTSQGTGPTEGTTYYSTSKGCPTGMYQWPDKWGNPGCKAF